MCGQAYLTSARIAEAAGPCAGYAVNEEPFLEVIRMHWNAVNGIDSKLVPPAMYKAARRMLGQLTSWARQRITATRRPR